jgi:16S rRNA (guanine527-N7)-methyltransferase
MIDRHIFHALWTQWGHSLAWELTPQQQDQLAHLYHLVMEGNRQQNLTRITKIADFWEKHLWDSLFPLTAYFTQAGLRLIDIGTGAGFPGLPLAVVCPSWQVVLLDSRRKKTAFIDRAIHTLGLTNAQTVTDRAENYQINGTGYDLAVIRAVGTLELCAQYSLPLLKPTGTAVLYRGHWTPEDELAVHQICGSGQWHLSSLTAYVTPITHSQRHSLSLQKC